ncbi:MAG: hypothetical protein A3H95_16915 [Acidobacteria bacterium RIFCSPLOWO2_02_FULL_64_15]|nr:MAG: hypothetical protein A3H95_16915 [Acidobacteria bacterium RIFCSPLOWO2_02_FULL_64_15]
MPAVASLPARDPAERRNFAARKALLRRVRGEFEEMPGLTLTLAQAGRLFGISSDACARIFGQLSEEGLLQPSRHGGYARRFEHP